MIYDTFLMTIIYISLTVFILGIKISITITCFPSFPLSLSILHNDKPQLEVSELYWHLKESVAKMELVLLRALQFKFQLDLPHRVKYSVYY